MPVGWLERSGALAAHGKATRKVVPMNIIQELEKEQAAAIMGGRAVPDFAPGDTVKVNVKVTEGTRTRIQAYEGVVIARSGGGLNEKVTTPRPRPPSRFAQIRLEYAYARRKPAPALVPETVFLRLLCR
jgi:hypothetical protein